MMPVGCGLAVGAFRKRERKTVALFAKRLQGVFNLQSWFETHSSSSNQTHCK
jgi:hypothetical protein